MKLQQHGLLAQLPESILSQGSAGDNSPTGNWVGMALRVSSLVYDPRTCAAVAAPASLLDLAQPQWKGKVAIAPTDSDFPPLVGAVIATHGEAAARDWLDRPEAQRADLPGRGGGRRRRQPRRRGDRRDQPVLLVPPPARARREGDAQRALLLLARRRRLGRQHLRGGACSRRASSRRTPSGSSASCVSKAGQQIIADERRLRVSRPPGRPAQRALPPLASIGHTSLSVAALGNGELAARLIRQAGLV